MSPASAARRSLIGNGFQEAAWFNILPASNGTEAIAKATESSSDLIIMDVLGPETDGMKALERLKQDARTASIPVIWLTGLGQPAARRQVEEEGTATYLAKPFSPSKLPHEVERIVSAD